MCSPPWPSSTRLLRQDKLLDITTACTTWPPATREKMADITTTLQWQTPLPWANEKNYGQTFPSNRLSTLVHSITAPYSTRGARTLLGSALYVWTGLGSAWLHAAWLCLSPGLAFSHRKEEWNGAASAVWWLFIPPEAMFPAMTSCSALSVYQNHSLFLPLWDMIRRKVKQAQT